jgi:hypothetical protein
MTNFKQIVFCLLLLVFSSIRGAASLPQKSRPPAPSAGAGSGPAPAEDISGMYTFLKEGEFLQITLDQNGVSGYISRQGDLDSDRGAFLDQFFSVASVHGHDVAFTTKPVHGVWFEFKGRFDRGAAKTKKDDGYYVVRGTLKEFTTGTDKNTSSRSRQVEFKLLAQPEQ